MEYHLFKAGERILLQGEQSELIYFMHTGSAKVTRTRVSSFPLHEQDAAAGSTEPDERILRVLGGGALLGAVNVIDGGGYVVNAFALEKTGCFAMPSEDFRRFLREFASLNDAFLRYLTQEVRTAYAHEELLSLHNVGGALAGQLLLLADNFGVPQDDGSLLLPVPLKQSTLASLIGHARPTVNRVLNQFLTERWISSHPHYRIAVLDSHSLRRTLDNAVPRGESTARKRPSTDEQPNAA